MKKNKRKIIGVSFILVFCCAILIVIFWYQIKTKYITLDGEFTDLTNHMLKEAAQEIIILDEMRYQEIERLEKRKWDLEMYYYRNGKAEIEDSAEIRKERETELAEICSRLKELGVSERSAQKDFKIENPELPGYQFPGYFKADYYFQEVLVDEIPYTLYIENVNLDFRVIIDPGKTLIDENTSKGAYILSGHLRDISENIKYIYLFDPKSKQWKLIFSGNMARALFNWIYITQNGNGHEYIIEYETVTYPLNYEKYSLETIVRYGLMLEQLDGKPLDCIQKRFEATFAHERTEKKFTEQYPLYGRLYPEQVKEVKRVEYH